MTDLELSFAKTRQWIQSNWNQGMSALYEGGTHHLMPTCFAVLAAECCGFLPEITSSQRQDTGQAILDRQDSETGLFGEGVLRRQDLSSHRPIYLDMQHTYFALQALNALGLGPRYRLSIVGEFKSVEYLKGWIDGGPWNNPWLHSNNIMFALSFLQQEYGETGDSQLIGAFDAILDYLDARQDSTSGLWQPEGGVDDRNAVFAAYHFLPFYFWRGRCPSYVDHIIDTTLNIQEADGFFLPNGGGACEDLDAVHILVMMSLVSDHRAGDVRKCLENCASAILESQKPNGGYCNYNRSRDRFIKRVVHFTNLDQLLLRRSVITESWKYSGWRPLTCPIQAPDMWSAWFRSLSLRLIADRYPDRFTGTPDCGYRRLPGLGWHDNSRIATAERVGA